MSEHTIHIVCGPTAGGKSARALELARDLNGVIINCDSMQIYSDLPILTAQPSQDELKQAPHLLYSALHPNAPCSAGNWNEMARPLIQRVLSAGQTPIICGGTGLYIKALMEGLSPIPDIPQNVRERVVNHYETVGAEIFFQELEARDPVMAARFHANHKARIIRAMEVLEATGKSLAQWQNAPREKPPEHWTFNIHKVLPDREVLKTRCNERFIWMIENGALEEVQNFATRLRSGDINHNVPLVKALGFKPLCAYLDGEMSKDDAVTRAQADTRQYAKRQMTWFRNQI